MLRDKKVSPCNACYACMETHTCAIKDDMADIFPKLLKADVILLASPVYFYSVSAQMKALIDRCLAAHKSLAGKQFYPVSSGCAGKEYRLWNGNLGQRGCLPASVL